MNAIVFTFVVASFIGLRECVEDALAWHPRLQTSVLRLLKDGDSYDEVLAEESRYGFRKALRPREATLYEAANADSEILRPVVASPHEKSPFCRDAIDHNSARSEYRARGYCAAVRQILMRSAGTALLWGLLLASLGGQAAYAGRRANHSGSRLSPNLHAGTSLGSESRRHRALPIL